MTKIAALYARVSSDRQKESGTIASQTDALRRLARRRGYVVPPEWVFQDDGFSGAHLDRPGLEAVRDLAAEGRLEAVLVLSPDRLSRKYAYQVLLLEEFERGGVACEFAQAPPEQTPQQRLLVQVQGMIAEYERAQITERSRRGKRYKARQGSPSVLSGAPYGYRYVKRSEGEEARYEILAQEAAVVRQVFDWYTQDPCSISEIARRLTRQGIRTRTGKRRWDPRVIWGMLRNPAYCGRAAYGKTGTGERKRVTRPLRGPGKFASRRVRGRERPRGGVDRDPGSGAGECGAVRTGTRAVGGEQAACGATDEGADAAAGHVGVPTLRICVLSGVDADDEAEAVLLPLPGHGRLALRGGRALRDPAGASGPARRGRVGRVGEVAGRTGATAGRAGASVGGGTPDGSATAAGDATAWGAGAVGASGARLVTAYQEELIELEELRRRMPPLRSRMRVVEAELEAVESAAEDRERHLRVAETLESFRERLRAGAGTLGIRERQKVLRSLVKEVLVDDGEITIRHSIPVTGAGGSSPVKPAPNSPRPSPPTQSYLLRWGRRGTPCGCPAAAHRSPDESPLHAAVPRRHSRRPEGRRSQSAPRTTPLQTPLRTPIPVGD